MSAVTESPTLQKLIRKVGLYTPKSELAPVRKAVDYALANMPDSSGSVGGEPMETALGVGLILAEMQVDVNTVAAGILHRIANGGASRINEIKKLFGEKIGFLVNSTTKVARMEFQATEEAQVENFRKMLLAMSRDIRVIMIRFADQLYELRGLDERPGPERLRIARETLDIYAPLANRLGIGWLKIEFEDKGFRHLMPSEYKQLEKKVAARKKDQEGYIEEVVGIIRKRLSDQNINAKIFGRVKHNYGIYQKLKRQGIPFEKVYDVMGIRIITDTPGDCYTILGMIHGMYTPVPGRLKDFIGAAKSNGYQSLQTTVIGPGGEKVEFQIRTEEMNQVAEQGIAAHWRYKEKEPLSEREQAIFESLREMIQGYQDIQDSQDFLDSVKGDLFSHVVYVFTPEGDLRELPAGASPVDFAYSVHSEVGNQCVGARVNGKIVPLRHVLQNGDTVEILTHKGHGPSRDWLKFVKTSRARNRIRAWIRSEERSRSISLGTQLMERELRKNDLSPRLLKSSKLEEVGAQYGFKSVEDLLVAIGYGKYSARQVIHRLVPESTRAAEPAPQEIPEKVPTTKARDRKGVRITGIDGLLYHFSKCCYPLPGDDITGFVTRGRGVAIHTRDCPNLGVMAVDKDRLIDVEWETAGQEAHPVSIRVIAKDKQGLLATITATLSAEKVNIRSLDSGMLRDMTAYFNFMIEVNSKKQLEGLLRKLRLLSGVIDVQRSVRA